MNINAPAALSTEPEHPIAVVANRTGLSRDVLRVWERRYNAVDPARSAGGHPALSAQANISPILMIVMIFRAV